MTDEKMTKDRNIPWLALLLGTIVTLLMIGVGIVLLGSFLTQSTVDESLGQEITIIRLTAPPLPTATQAVIAPIPTLEPTVTPIPTPDFSVAQPVVTAGYYAQVVDTGGVGVTVRNGPNTSNLPVTVAAEGLVLFVIEGPQDGGGYQWWRIRLPDNTDGWVVNDFLAPSAAP